jgi:hypothetical protein
MARFLDLGVLIGWMGAAAIAMKLLSSDMRSQSRMDVSGAKIR